MKAQKTTTRPATGGRPSRATAAPANAAGSSRNVDKRIYDAVFMAVRSQQLLPGTKLTEGSLSELFGVSRTIVRKALQRLGHEHIVELRPHRGAIIASPSRQETAEVFAARRAIEGAIAPLVIQNATRAQLSRLKLHIRQEHRALHEGDRPTWIHLTGEFHMMLAEIGGNRVLSRYLSELVSRCSLIIALYGSRDSVCDDHEHDDIVEAIAKRDLKRLAKTMDRHLLDIEHQLKPQDEATAINLAHLLKFA